MNLTDQTPLKLIQHFNTGLSDILKVNDKKDPLAQIDLLLKYFQQKRFAVTVFSQIRPHKYCHILRMRSKPRMVFIDQHILKTYLAVLSTSQILVSIVVSIPACHAGDRGSIPRRGDFNFLEKYYRAEDIKICFLACNFFFAYIYTCKYFFKVFKIKKFVSEVGFEPTPAYADQNTHLLSQARISLSLAP